MQKSSSLNSVSFKLKSSLTDSISQSFLFPLATHSISPSLRSLHHSFPLPISLYLSLTLTRQQLSLYLFQESRNPKTQREKHQQTPLPPPSIVATSKSLCCCRLRLISLVCFFCLCGLGLTSWVSIWVSGYE